MASYGFNSPNVQGVTTPLSTLSHSNLASANQSPLNQHNLPENSALGTQTREISTVYLPPIRYRYDTATGTLVQVSGNSPVNNTSQSPLSQNQPNFSPPLVSFTPNLGQQNPTSQTFYTQPNPLNHPSTPSSQPLNFTPEFLNSYNAQVTNLPIFLNGTFYPNPPATQLPQGHLHSTPPYQPNLPTGQLFQPYLHSTSQGNVNPYQGNLPHAVNVNGYRPQASFHPSSGYQGNLHNGYNSGFQQGQTSGYNPMGLYDDTPRLRYEAAVQEYYDRMRGNFSGYNPQETPNGFSQAFSNAFSTFGNAVSDFKNTAFKIFSQNSPDFLRAAVFRLHRLENVPVNPMLVQRLKFSVCAYFDPSTENHNMHTTDHYRAFLTSDKGVECDFGGQVLRVPWRDEEFVFLKILQHVGNNSSVLGRLQLKLSSLVTGHPLKVVIIGDDGRNKGHAILEFAVGAVNLEDLNRSHPVNHVHTVNNMNQWSGVNGFEKRTTGMDLVIRPTGTVSNLETRPGNFDPVTLCSGPVLKDLTLPSRFVSILRSTVSLTTWSCLDSCRYGNKCLYLHSIKRVLYMPDVFKGGVYCSTVAHTSDNALELFACGHGPTIKRFKFFSSGPTEVQISASAAITLQMPPERLTHTHHRQRHRGPVNDQAIHSLLFMDQCLFAGLKTGHISVLHLPSNTTTILDGHESAVSAVTVIEGVVVSACEGGKINLWRYETDTFRCVNSILTNAKVNSLLYFCSEASAPVQHKLLWSGGSEINIINLNALEVVKCIKLPSNVSVMSFMRYGVHVLVGFTNGYVKVYTGLGEEVYMREGETNTITAMDGMQTLEGDFLLVGTRAGELNMFNLPSFNLQYTMLCHADGHKKSGISKISPIGTQHFITTGYDGNISVYMWNLC